VLLLPVNRLLGYVGPGPGQEFIPYFLALVAWAGTAFAAILLRPILAWRRWLLRNRSAAPAEVPNTPSPAMVQEPPGDGRTDNP
jgi:hypothetical protein